MEFRDEHLSRAQGDLKRLAAAVAKLAGGAALLSQADLKPEQFRWMLGRLFVIEVLNEPRDYRYRLFGTKMAEVYGVDLTGVYLSTLAPEKFESAMRLDYDLVVESRMPHFRRGRLLWPGKEFIRLERLLIPVSDNGATVSRILGGVWYSPLGLLTGRTPDGFEIDAFDSSV